MISPPRPPLRYAKPPSSTSRPAQKGSNQRVQREVLVQCDRCKFPGTARSNGDRITEYLVPNEGGRHRGCGGAWVNFDIGGEA